MAKTLEVNKKDTLLNYLLNSNTGLNRSKLKTLLKNKCIRVEHEIITQFDHPLHIGQTITIDSFNNKVGLNFTILHEDNDIIVIDKPSGILSIPAEKGDRGTAFDLVREYEKKKNPRGMIFSVHRLDQGTSGVLMFAKHEKAKKAYQSKWNELVKERVYVAYVEGILEEKKGTITSFLKEGKTTQMYSASEGKEAITHYKVIQEMKHNSILSVSIDTGRQNQIRVHLHDLGHPIVGDKKYDAQTNPFRRLGLHAHRLKIQDPKTKKIQEFCAKVPTSFELNKKI